MTQTMLVLQIASQPWCVLLGRISNESKARPRQCNCSARPVVVAREDATCYEMPPPRDTVRKPPNETSVERRRGDLSQIRQGRRRRKNTAVPAAAPKANKK